MNFTVLRDSLFSKLNWIQMYTATDACSSLTQQTDKQANRKQSFLGHLSGPMFSMLA
jgi:hypothetical protein